MDPLAHAKVPGYVVEHVESLAKTAQMQARLFVLAPGQCIPWHYHSEVTDWYFCLEGSLHIEIRAPRSNSLLRPGGMLKVAPKTTHKVEGQGDRRCRFLLVQGVGAYDFNSVSE
ncbi:MAG: cupin domain-containing protein [Pseudomonadota bacterium]